MLSGGRSTLMAVYCSQYIHEMLKVASVSTTVAQLVLLLTVLVLKEVKAADERTQQLLGKKSHCPFPQTSACLLEDKHQKKNTCNENLKNLAITPRMIFNIFWCLV